jgi:hypothetical protein
MRVPVVAVMAMSAVPMAFMAPMYVVMSVVVALARRAGDRVACLGVVRVLSHLLYSTHRPYTAQPSLFGAGVRRSTGCNVFQTARCQSRLSRPHPRRHPLSGKFDTSGA